MKNLMDFSDSALSRTEMKSVKGGCAIVSWSGGSKGSGVRYQSTVVYSLAYVKQQAAQNGAGYGWCCASCL
jgi:hypothetical protein